MLPSLTAVHCLTAGPSTTLLPVHWPSLLGASYLSHNLEGGVTCDGIQELAPFFNWSVIASGQCGSQTEMFVDAVNGAPSFLVLQKLMEREVTRNGGSCIEPEWT